MASTNDIRTLSFSNPWIRCMLIQSVKDVAIEGAVVVNLATTPACYQAGGFSSVIPPFQSKQLKGCIVTWAERIAVFTLQKSENLGGLALAWNWFGNVFTSFNPEAPLYISSQEHVGDVQFNPRDLFNFDGSKESLTQRFHLQVHLWYAPAQTDCGIHCEHSFLEVHSQIVGTGRMQKFRTGDAETLFEDLVVPPGATHEPFFQFSADDGFKYPMHRYLSQTDCVWLAIEFHPF